MSKYIASPVRAFADFKEAAIFLLDSSLRVDILPGCHPSILRAHAVSYIHLTQQSTESILREKR